MSDTSANRVFNVPELLGAICDHSDNTVRIRLFRTSRSAFEVAVPRIWNSLPNVLPLLKLLGPTGQLKKTPKKYVEITFPSYSSTSFARFDLYSPSIQQLTISDMWKMKESTVLPFQLSSWEIFAQRAQLDTPLVPNLSVLEFMIDSESNEDILLWLSTFTSSVLRTVVMRSMVYGLNAVVLLGFLAQNHPQLECLLANNLSLLPLGTTPLDDPKKLCIVQMAYRPMVAGYLHCFQVLTRLAIQGHFITSASLVAISCLPKLVNLEIDNSREHDNSLSEIFRSTQLSDNPFPALIILNLAFCELDTILAAWDITPLVQKLQTVNLQYFPFKEKTAIYEEKVIGCILPLVSKRSPHIQKMGLYGHDMEWEDLPGSTFLESWHCLTHLQLRYLTLGSFNAGLLFMTEKFPILPHLTTLELPYQVFTLGQLAELGRIAPGLCNLSCNFKDPLDKIPLIKYQTTAPLCTIKLVLMLHYQLDIPSPDKAARFLRSIWPNLQEIVYDDGSQESQLALEMVNLHLQVAHGVAETKKNISALLGPDAVLSLLHRRLSAFQ